MLENEWIEVNDRLPDPGLLVDFLYADGDGYLTMMSNDVDWKRSHFPPILWRISSSLKPASASRI